MTPRWVLFLLHYISFLVGFILHSNSAVALSNSVSILNITMIRDCTNYLWFTYVFSPLSELTPLYLLLHVSITFICIVTFTLYDAGYLLHVISSKLAHTRIRVAAGPQQPTPKVSHQRYFMSNDTEANIQYKTAHDSNTIIQ